MATPTPYTTSSVPPWDEERRDAPSSYSLAPVPSWREKRDGDDPSGYPTGTGVPGWKRDEPSSYPVEPPPSWKRQEPEPYPTEPVPGWKRQEPEPYPTGPVPGWKRDEPSSYSLEPPPSWKRQEPEPYPTGPVPGWKRDEPSSYSLEPPPSWKRDEPSPYPTGPVPGWKRQEPEPYPTGPVPGWKRDEPSSYSLEPPPSWKRQEPEPYPTGPVPGWKRQEPEPYPTGPVPGWKRDEVKRDSTITSGPSATATQKTSPTTHNAPATTTTFPYTQMGGIPGGSARPWYFPAASIAAGDYSTFCPSGNCFQDCQNMTRVFQALPDGINLPESTYGKAYSNGSLPDETLFGVCSNLGSVAELAQTNYSGSSFASFFPVDQTQSALANVSTDLSQCLFDTCQHTRDPTTCQADCSINSIQISNTSVSIIGMYPCLYRLCSNTCGLPYANQDMYGVGVLASYITQAILVLLLAVVLIGYASWRSMKQVSGKTNDAEYGERTQYTASRRMKQSLELFLATECYFGISACIASYLMHPATIDPLNGYALLSVSITGFIPPVFTLMLLHGHGVKSWYTTLLTFATWLFSTVLFFMLVRNLSHTVNNSRAIDRGLDSLFTVDSCGKSSAMNLCKQAFDTDPLQYLSWFYNYWQIPSIKTVPVLWVLSTVVLLILVGKQTYDHLREHTRDEAPISLEAPMAMRNKRVHAAIGLGSLYLGTILFGLALGYQACMVISYTRMDVIDWNGWSFGQIVALLFWVPPIINCIWSYTVQPKREHDEEQRRRRKQWFKYNHKPGRPRWNFGGHHHHHHHHYHDGDEEKHHQHSSASSSPDDEGPFGGSLSSDQLSFVSPSDRVFFSPPNPSVWRAGSDVTTVQSDRLQHAEAVLDEYAHIRQDNKKSKNAHSSVKDVIIR